MRICSVDGCERKHHGKGYCSMHLHRTNRSQGLEKEPALKPLWRAMIARCHRPSNRKYPIYGARGIKVHDTWRNSYETFATYVGTRPSSKHSLDRINNNGNYEPGNVRWATPTEQGNNRRDNILITIDNETRTLEEWCRTSKIGYGTVWSRIKVLGMSPQDALTLPIERTHCTKNHPLSGDNLRINKKTGQRVCRQCNINRSKAYKERKQLA